MAERGYITVLDASDRAPFEEFQVDSTSPVAFELRVINFGAETPLDVSAGNLLVRFRLAIIGTTSVPVDEVLSNVTDGTDGRVEGSMVAREGDFTSVINEDGKVEASVVVVDTNTPDANTKSGSKETEWFGRWLVFIRQAIDEAA